LETVIGELFIADNHGHPEFSARWHSRALQALAGFENNIVRRYFSSIKDQALRRYMRYYQLTLTGLSNRLYYFTARDSATAALVGAVLEKIESVLVDLKRTFSDAFDLECAVTLYSHQFYTEKLHQVLGEFEGIRTDEALLSLLGVIRNSLRDHLHISLALRPGYIELEQIQRFAALVLLFAAEPETDARKLFYRLYTENFNLSGLVEWYQDQLLAELKGLTREERERRLAEEEAKLLKTGIPPRVPFDKRRGPISETLLDWLARIRSHSTGAYLRTDTPLLRLALDLSVAQLGLFLRLCYFTGCFHEHNISAVLRFFSQHFTSKKQNQVSLKSLAKAFYGAEITTAAANRAWLQRMIDHLNKKYFPK